MRLFLHAVGVWSCVPLPLLPQCIDKALVWPQGNLPLHVLLHLCGESLHQSHHPSPFSPLSLPLQSMLCADPVYMHSSCVLLHKTPDFVVFQEITETSKLYMRGVCAVEASWLPRIQPDYCTFSPPLEDPPPFFDSTTGTVSCHMTCTYGMTFPPSDL